MRILNDRREIAAAEGTELGVSEWIQVTQERINFFADATGDRQWIHIDTERARAEMPQGKTIAHGFLTLSLLSLLVKEAVLVKGNFTHGINYGFNRVRFANPVPVDSHIRARCTLMKVEDVTSATQICWAVTVDVKDVSKPALVAEWLVRYYH